MNINNNTITINMIKFEGTEINDVKLFQGNKSTLKRIIHSMYVINIYNYLVKK